MSTATELPRSLAQVLDRVHIEPDRCSAVVDGHRIEAGDPAELRLILAGRVYEVLHAGQGATLPELPFHTRDRGFEKLLFQAVPHQEALLELPLLQLDETTAVVLRDGVRVRVSRDRVGQGTAGELVSVRAAACRALLSPGFFFVDGTRCTLRARGLLRLYVHLTHPQAAPEVWAAMLEHAQACGRPYRAKVLSIPALYPRRDALVMYLGGAGEPVQDVAHGFVGVLHGMPGIGDATPAMAERQASGVATAEEPADPRKGYQGLSFGQHRSQVLVDALWAATESGYSLDQTITAAFAEAHIDIRRPSRNYYPTSTSPPPGVLAGEA